MRRRDALAAVPRSRSRPSRRRDDPDADPDAAAGSPGDSGSGGRDSRAGRLDRGRAVARRRRPGGVRDAAEQAVRGLRASSITNETLVTDPNRGQLTTCHPAPPKPAVRHGRGRRRRPAGSPTPAAAAAARTPTPAEGAKRRSGASSRGRSASASPTRRSASRASSSEAKKLENDFYAWDDGQYRDNVIKPAWDKKREELETARRDLEEAEKDLAELPEKARKAGALPGWIRE